MVKGIVYLVIGTVALLFGAARPWMTSFYAVLMILGFGICMWQGGLTWRPGRWAWGIVGFFLVVTALQLVPVSNGLLEVLSPFRAGVLDSGFEILGSGFGIQDSGYAIAYSVYQGVARWGFVVCLGLFFWLCVSLAKERKTFKRMVMVLMGLAVFEMIYGLLQVMFPNMGVWWVWLDSGAGCARGTYINRNHFAGFMEMVWPIALAVTLAQGSGKKGRGLKPLWLKSMWAVSWWGLFWWY